MTDELRLELTAAVSEDFPEPDILVLGFDEWDEMAYLEMTEGFPTDGSRSALVYPTSEDLRALSEKAAELAEKMEDAGR